MLRLARSVFKPFITLGVKYDETARAYPLYTGIVTTVRSNPDFWRGGYNCSLVCPVLGLAGRLQQLLPSTGCFIHACTGRENLCS